MDIPLRDFGKFGIITDYPSHATPVSAWSDGRNVKFSGGVMQRALEPDQIIGNTGITDEMLWMQQFWDGSNSVLAVATANNFYIWDQDLNTWVFAGTSVSTAERWQAVTYGNSCIFNNGLDAPYVFNSVSRVFVPLPRWGVLSSETVTATCRAIFPHKGFLVAINISEDADQQPNTIWWSNAASGPNLWDIDDAPDWDYQSATSLSAKRQIALEDGPLQWACHLGEGLIIYSNTSAHSMLITGGANVFQTRRLFDYGCAGLYCAVEFGNRNLVIDSKTIYVHDGSTVQQIAEDRIKDTFFNDLYSSTFTGGSLTLDFQALDDSNPFSSINMAVNTPTREIYVYYDSQRGETDIPNPRWTDGGGEPDALTKRIKSGLIYNYEDDNWTFIDASSEELSTFQPGGAGEYQQRTLIPIDCMVFGLSLTEATTWATLGSKGLSWQDLGSITWNDWLGGLASTTELFWMSSAGIYQANKLSRTDLELKQVFVEKVNIDLDENMQTSTAVWKQMKRMYPHVVGNGVVDIEVGWSPSLMGLTAWGKSGVLKLNLAQGESQAKVDFRTTGRYLGMRFSFNNCGIWKMTGADIVVVPRGRR